MCQDQNGLQADIIGGETFLYFRRRFFKQRPYLPQTFSSQAYIVLNNSKRDFYSKTTLFFYCLLLLSIVEIPI